MGGRTRDALLHADRGSCSLRILMICLRYPPAVGGTERAARVLSRALAERGHAVDVVTGVDAGVEPDSDPGVNVVGIPLPRNPPRGLRFSTEVTRVVRHLSRPDIVNAHMASAPAMAALVVACSARCPVVVKPSSASGALGGNLADVRRRPLGEVRIALLRRRVSAWVAVSRGIEEELTKSWRIPSSRIARIPNAAETSGFRPTNRRRSNEVCRYLYVGRLEAVKGVDVLLEAWYRAGEPGHLVIVGDGSERVKLEAAAPATVSFLGEVVDTGALYADADVFVLPSLREGLSNALVEALLCGLPVIATNVGETAATLGSSGRLVAPGDAATLAEALRAGPPLPADPQDAAGRFAASAVAEQHERLYVSLLSS